MAEHRSRCEIPTITAYRHEIIRLVHVERDARTFREAIRREKQLKGWRRYAEDRV